MNKVLKVLYIHHYGQFSGAAKSLSYIVNNIDKNTYSPVLVNIEKGPVNEFFTNLPSELILISGIRAFHGSTVVEKSFKLFVRNWIFLLPSIFKAYRFLKKQKADLIHLNSTCLFAFGIAAYFLDIKVICHVREPIRDGLWGAPLRFFCKKFINNYIAICEYDMKSLRLPNSSKYKSEVIYNFVDKLKFVNKDVLVSKLGIDNNKDVIFLYLARFAKSNGWVELINMAEKTIKENPNFHFVFVGAQNDDHLKYDVLSNIHVFPFVKDVNIFLYGADIFVCPFVLPHFARGVIEASAVGLPVIGSNVGGVNELVIHNKTGYLYSNETQFLEYASKLGNNLSIRKKFGSNGIVFAKDKFDMNKNLTQTFNFYSQIIN